MTQEELQKRKERAENETFVISLTDDGKFRIYSPAYPTKSYAVSGMPEAPRCTCPDFENHKDDPEWRCKHILAVLAHLKKEFPEDDPYEAEERRAIQEEGQAPPREKGAEQSPGACQMVIKRSVSPDGRIDSLSVEFMRQIENVSEESIRPEAERILSLQSKIVEQFLGETRKETGERKEQKPAEPNSDGSVPAQMMTVGSTNGKWGPRLFISFEVNGQTLRLYGNKKQLADCIVAAGFPDLSEHIAEGTKLNLPCRVITKPSDDGKYINIERVLPIELFRSHRKSAQ